MLTALFIVGVITAVVVGGEELPVTCSSVIKLESMSEHVRLHSHDVKYGSGSGQQSVTGMPTSDDTNSHWQILGANGEPCQRGRPIKCGSLIRLMHLSSRCFLHSHNFPAPLSRGVNQEVSCYGKEGEKSDTGDHYKVICGADEWTEDEEIRLRHEDTGNFLATSGQQYGRPIAGQREVVCSQSTSREALWKAAEGIYIKPEL